MSAINTQTCADALRAESITLLNGMMEFSALVDNKLSALKEEEEKLLVLSLEVNEKLKTLEEKEQHHNAVLARVTANKCAAKCKVSLNVGGRVFTAPAETFLRWKDSYFYSLLTSDSWKVDEDGEYFVNRSPKFFDRIMTSLRSGDPVDQAGLSPEESLQLSVETDYYQVPSKVDRAHMMWDAKCCDRNLVISEDGRTVTMTCSGNSARVLSTIPDTSHFHVYLRKLEGYMSVGYQSAHAHFHYYLLADGTLYSGEQYCPRLVEGDVVTALFDSLACTISFAVNGTSYGIAYRQNAMRSGAFFPCVVLTKIGASVSFQELLPGGQPTLMS